MFVNEDSQSSTVGDQIGLDKTRLKLKHVLDFYISCTLTHFGN